MIRELPKFKSYFVDIRLAQFRRIAHQKVEFIDFNSTIGQKLLTEYRKHLDLKEDVGKSSQS